MDDEAMQQQLQRAFNGVTGVGVALFRQSLGCEGPVVRIDARAEAGFVHVEYADGHVLCYAHDQDVPVAVLEKIYSAIAARLRLH